MVAKLAEPYISLETALLEVASLKEQVTHSDIEKGDSDKLMAEIPKDSELRMVRLNIAIVGRSRAHMLAHALMTESVKAVDAVALQLDYNVVSWLRQGL